jgi:hypothetical protein
MHTLITYMAIYGLLFRYRDFWDKGLLLGLGMTVFVGFGGELNIALNRRWFLRRRRVDLRKCVLLYYGWLWSELIMTPTGWYQRTWGPWPIGWRDVTPVGSVAARYRGWLRGLAITFGNPCMLGRSLTIEPLRAKWALVVVERLVDLSPLAAVSGLAPRNAAEVARRNGIDSEASPEAPEAGGQ